MLEKLLLLGPFRTETARSRPADRLVPPIIGLYARAAIEVVMAAVLAVQLKPLIAGRATSVDDAE